MLPAARREKGSEKVHIPGDGTKKENTTKAGALKEGLSTQ